MSAAEATELTDVLNRVKTWPTTLRITLARRILQSVDGVESPAAMSAPKTRGLSAAEVRALIRTDRTPPDDETMERWIDEYRMEKYGSSESAAPVRASDRGGETMNRCGWAKDDLSIRYHDEEWGVPVHDDRRWFEFLVLEGAQAGLSWENYRRAFAGFDPAVVARFKAERIEKLLADPGIVRNRLKVTSVVRNAQAFLAIQKEIGSFDAYIWPFVGGQPLRNTWRSLDQVPARTEISDALSKDLKRRGFTFVGSTICYALMQATGLVNDHLVGCVRHSGAG
jgi:DNA-3-methyladenine glycosylase I